MQGELEDLKKTHQAKVDELDMIEREYKKLQEKHRDVLNNEYNLQNVRDHLEVSVKISQEELQKVNQQYDESAMRWKAERADLH